MVCLFVNTCDYQVLIHNILNKAALNLSDRGINIDISEKKLGRTTVFRCICTEDVRAIWLERLADSLSEILTKSIALKYIDHLVNSNYSFLKDAEKKSVCKKASRTYFQEQRAGIGLQKKDIFRELLGYLQEADTIVFEGFISFRLQDFMNGLKIKVERALDDHMLEKEYREFRKLLQYFVDIQEPQNGILNIFCFPGGEIIITNDKGVPLSENCLDEALQVLMEKNLDSEDILISTLLALAPKEILIHTQEETELTELIKSVFGNRVKICLGCPLCKEEIGNSFEKPDLPIH